MSIINELKYKSGITEREEYLDEAVLQAVVDRIYSFINKASHCAVPSSVFNKRIADDIKSGTASEETKSKLKTWVHRTWKNNKKFIKALPEDVVMVMAIFPGISKILDAVGATGTLRDMMIPLILCFAFEAKAKTKDAIKKKLTKYKKL